MTHAILRRTTSHARTGGRLRARRARRPDERAAFEAHLATCAECEGEVRALMEVARVLAQAAPQVEPPAALRARVLSQVSQAGATDLRAGKRESVVPMSAPGGASTSPLWLSGLAVAASLAMAVAFGLYAFQLRGRIDTLEARLQDALARAQASESQMAATRRVMGEAQSQLAVLTAPDAVRIDLAGQSAAPSASARAFWSRSRGLVLAASNLPRCHPAGCTSCGSWERVGRRALESSSPTPRVRRTSSLPSTRTCPLPTSSRSRLNLPAAGRRRLARCISSVPFEVSDSPTTVFSSSPESA